MMDKVDVVFQSYINFISIGKIDKAFFIKNNLINLKVIRNTQNILFLVYYSSFN